MGILEACKDCKRKFADNDALPNMQTPIEQVGASIGMYRVYSLHSSTSKALSPKEAAAAGDT